jgi:hypothetical protein
MCSQGGVITDLGKDYASIMHENCRQQEVDGDRANFRRPESTAGMSWGRPMAILLAPNQ